VKRRLVAAVMVVAVGVVPAASGSSQAPVHVFRTSGKIIRIAADGPRVVAATTGISKSCDRVVVWAESTGAFTSFKSQSHCPDGGVAGSLTEVALAGDRVAWVDSVGGNLLDVVLHVAPAAGGKATTVALAENHMGADDANDGDWLGSLVGHGSLLVYNSWSLCTAVPPGWEWGAPKCDQPGNTPRPALRRFNQALLKVVGARSVLLRKAPQAIWAVSVDGSRIATQNGSSVTLFSATGAILKTLKLPAGPVAGVRLEGSRLVALQGPKLEVYSTDSGQLVRTIPASSAKATLRDLGSGLAVYVDGLEVHVVRVADGKNAVYRGTRGPVDAQLEPQGLFYSYSVAGKARGRIVFVPLPRVEQRLG
jgi:hypothetical protein